MCGTVEEGARTIGPVRRLLPASFLLIGLALGATQRADAQAAAPVAVLKVQGVIDQALSSFVRSEIEDAAASGKTVVLQVDSRGTYGDEALDLAGFIRASGVPVIAWVGPAGARAAGGALFVVYGSSLVTMAPGAGLGPARPFDLGTRASSESAEAVAEGRAELRLLAPGAGASVTAVDQLVDGAMFAAGPAIRAGAASAAAPSVLELLGVVDGREVQTAAGTVTLETLTTPQRPVDVRFVDIGLFARILHAVSTPTAVYVLLLIGLWGIAFEFTQPGVGMAGIAGVLSLGLAGYGLSVIPVNWWGIGLIVAGTAAQGADVLIRRVAVLTIAGTVAFLVGSLLAWWDVAAAVDLSLWLVILSTVAGFLLFGFGMTVALRARERVRSAQIGLVGLVGEARSDLNPEGGVFVKGSLWRARSMNGPIPSGRRIRVKGIDGLILRVEEEPD
jgi:membrane-bound serine protease (ClpP class)